MRKSKICWCCKIEIAKDNAVAIERGIKKEENQPILLQKQKNKVFIINSL